MLVDLPPTVTPDTFNQALYGRDIQPVRVAQGVYLTHLNFTHDLKREDLLVTEYPFDIGFRYTHEERREMGEDEWMRLVSEFFRNPHVNDYGVCDDWEQITDRWPELLESERTFIISLTEMRREDQSPDGGWRWHKWGEYIGTFEPQCEYLYDEVGIDSVFCFHIIEVRV